MVVRTYAPVRKCMQRTHAHMHILTHTCMLLHMHKKTHNHKQIHGHTNTQSTLLLFIIFLEYIKYVTGSDLGCTRAQAEFHNERLKTPFFLRTHGLI